MKAAYEDITLRIGTLVAAVRKTRGLQEDPPRPGDPEHEEWMVELESIDQLLEATTLMPAWWDENGTPRFGAHHPDLRPDIYADEVALLVISCQSCGREFRVQMSWSMMDAIKHELVTGRRGHDAKAFDITLSALQHELHARNAELGDAVYPAVLTARDDLARRRAFATPKLAAMVLDGTIHYGDPPNVACCPAGPTMDCWDLRVLEFWERGRRSEDDDAVKAMEWRRRADLEIELPDASDDERERV